MYIEYGEDSTEEIKQLESIAMKAKAGVLAGEETFNAQTQNGAGIGAGVIAGRAPPSVPTTTLQIIARNTSRRGAALARGVN